VLLLCCILAVCASGRELRRPAASRNATRRSLPGAAGRPSNISRPERVPRIRQTCSAVTYGEYLIAITVAAKLSVMMCCTSSASAGSW
jgi:hypothetical protein